ncbi:MAG: AgmX/PglI C-terminal domain-containing protein [Anaeromyxobacter sp.]|nr:AgmX/PglI C-terminal domain-containing protein [Anaeromyxobacter sp.]
MLPALLIGSSSCARPLRFYPPLPVPDATQFPAEPDKNSVSLFALTKADDLVLCHRAFVRTKTPSSGRTVIQFSIRPDGGVEGARVVETTLEDPKSIDCMVEAVSRWKTPFRPAASRTFRYPYTAVAEDYARPVAPR